MKAIIILLIILILPAGKILHSQSNQIQYINPLHDSQFNNKETTILFKFNYLPSSKILNDYNRILVKGSISGIHTGKIIITRDNKTVIFKPDKSFSLGETVDVVTNFFSPFKYSFKIKEKDIYTSPMQSLYSELPKNYNKNNKIGNMINDTLPQDFPVIQLNTINNPSTGRIFLSNFPFNLNLHNSPFLVISENNARNYYYKRMPAVCYDFKVQPNGYLTYYSALDFIHYELDSNYNVFDIFYCGNGYAADLHELRVMNDGSAFLLAYDPEIVNMSNYVPNGKPNATVTGLIIQKIDIDKNVIFQWRSWDHYKITDATHIDFTADSIDYVHGNALEIDKDGNLLISCRHMDEITNINSQTGDIIWRLGGKNNQFNFTNDTMKFSHQHAIRRIKNGDITLFDNGNFHYPPFSRAVEYALDEQNKTITLIWQYRHSPDIFGLAMGYVQRLDNGNTFIGWGAANPSVTEVDPNGNKVLELNLPGGIFSYRAYKFDWPMNEKLLDVIPQRFELKQNFPNPFNPVTTIQSIIPKTENVSLDVYDVLGRLSSSLFRGTLTANLYRFSWKASNFSSGVYFYRLKTDDFVQTKQMLLLK